MKKQLISRLCACFVVSLCGLPLLAQGVIVYQKDGTKVKFPYEQIDSIVTYNYGEDVEDEVIEPSTLMYTANGVSFSMISVKGGIFIMGSTNEDAWYSEKPAHQVALDDFFIGMTEVTQELWLAVMGSNPSHFTGDLQRPVEYVSWEDCQSFISRLNELTGESFRLPTEAEWEYAAQGGNISNGYKHSGSDVIDDVAWYCENSSSTTHRVKNKQPNELGVYDMNGNVWEWCADYFDYYSASAVTNPVGPASSTYRVLRGGGWGDDVSYCRVRGRGCNHPQNRYNCNGLRLAMAYESGEGADSDGGVVPSFVEAVDLGLSVKWASCNVGAESPEEYGSYFAWGETSEKSNYSPETWMGIIGSGENLTAAYDAATVNWGGNWRMPTSEEILELQNNCTWEWIPFNGVNGYRVTGPSGNFIFLPATGCRYYTSFSSVGSFGAFWSATPCGNGDDACRLGFDLNMGGGEYFMDNCGCYYGLAVRPVTE